MAISLVTVGGKITAAIQNAIIGQVNAQGLTRIVPASVAGTGVSVGSGGIVMFTAATSVSVNGCFTTAFDNYRIVIATISRSVLAESLFRWRVGLVDNSTGNYSYVRGFDNAATRTVSGASAQTSSIIDVGGGANDVLVDAFGPALPVATRFVGASNGLAASTTYNMSESSFFTAATVFDGFSYYMASGTITGTLRIYGYNNN